MSRITSLAALFAFALLASSCREEAASSSEQADAPARQPAAVEQPTKTSDPAQPQEPAMPERIEKENGLVIVFTEMGKGPKPKTGEMVRVHYTGRFKDGKVFDSSAGGEPIQIPVNRRRVIDGWDQALLEMPRGSKATVTIPSALAYGKAGYDPVIPPDADLTFDMHLLEK